MAQHSHSQHYKDKDNKMKSILVIALTLGFTVAHAGGVMEKVCHEQKGKQVCKNVKVHKKVEGTVVPEPTPKSKKKK